MKKIIFALLLIIGSFSYSFGKEEKSIIKVTGESVVVTSPDTVRLNIYLSEVKPTYDETYQAFLKTFGYVQDKLRTKGVKKEQIKTVNFNIDSFYENERKENGNYIRKFVGYRYNHSIFIDLSINDKKIGEILGVFDGLKMKDMGISLEYKLKDESSIKDKAMAEAFNDANKKAKLLAKTGNFSLGKIVEINYNSKGSNVKTIPLIEKGMANMVKASADLGLQPDDLVYKDTVTIIWKIK